jgi:hypothetical protein
LWALVRPGACFWHVDENGCVSCRYLLHICERCCGLGCICGRCAATPEPASYRSWRLWAGLARHHAAVGALGTRPTRRSTGSASPGSRRRAGSSVTLVEWPHATRERACRSSCAGLRWYGTASRTRVHDSACCVRHYANMPTVLAHGNAKSHATGCAMLTWSTSRTTTQSGRTTSPVRAPKPRPARRSAGPLSAPSLSSRPTCSTPLQRASGHRAQ